MKKSILGVSMLLSTLTIMAADVYVAPAGNDSNDGSKSATKATLTSALRQAREMRRLSAPGIDTGITIHLSEGTYSLYEPVFIRPEDSGTAASPTVISGDGAGAWLSGGVKVDGWKRQGKLLVADAPRFNGRPLDFRQLYINGKKMVRARDVDDFEKMYRIISNDPANGVLWVPAEAVRKIVNAPYAEMVLHEMWCVANLRIKSIDI
ncbi:MAG: DUF1565 domain-containing protein, partial [Duncaniella sp.]|nr:DUF1565 domain-containing protein [Duncaniella sp.]